MFIFKKNLQIHQSVGKNSNVQGILWMSQLHHFMKQATIWFVFKVTEVVNNRVFCRSGISQWGVWKIWGSEILVDRPVCFNVSNGNIWRRSNTAVTERITFHPLFRMAYMISVLLILGGGIGSWCQPSDSLWYPFPCWKLSSYQA